MIRIALDSQDCFSSQLTDLHSELQPPDWLLTEAQIESQQNETVDQVPEENLIVQPSPECQFILCFIQEIPGIELSEGLLQQI